MALTEPWPPSLGRVDPGVGGDLRRRWWLADEPLWVRVVGRGQDDGALPAYCAGMSVVDVSGRVKAQAAMTMNVVIPGEEALAVGPCGFDRPELFGEVGAVLQSLERRLAVIPNSG